MTGHDEFSFAYKAIKLGVDDYLLKPFSPEELNAALSKTITGIEKERAVIETPKTRADKPAPGFKPMTKNELLTQKIDDYLYENYHREDCSLEKISVGLQFENSYLRRVYKHQTGITISRKLDEIRMNKAKEMLGSGLYWNKEIAYRVGFSDQYYFSKRFKQICGLTPTEYRNRVTNISSILP